MEYYKSYNNMPLRECYPITPPPYNCDYSLPMTKSTNFYATQTEPESFLRFPTPPNTPPKQISSPDAQSSRSRSVIMKVSDHQITEVEIRTKNVLENTLAADSFICRWENCWRSFESLDSLAGHVTQIHAVASAGGLYYCKWEGCLRSDRGFNARYKMLVHVRTHTKEKPHQCRLCEKSFSRAENLKIHMRSHSGEKPYICPYEGCNKAYSNSSDRFKHTRTHSTEKPYVCKVPGCQKRYTDPSSLRKHVKTFKHTPIVNLDQINLVSDISNDSHQEIIQHNELPYIEYQNYDETHHNIYQTQTTSPSPGNCRCSHVDCYDQYRNTEIYKYDHFYYEPQVVEPLTTTDYWSSVQRDRYLTSQSMDVDAPLDLSLRGRR